MLDADSILEELGAQEEAWQRPFHAAFETYCARAEQIWPPFKRPRLCFTVNGQVAGRAHYGPNEVRLNPVYCQTERENMLHDTIPHEIAHILAFQRYKDHAHGGSWYAMFGALTSRAPKRCHDYEHISRARAKVYGGAS